MKLTIEEIHFHGAAHIHIVPAEGKKVEIFAPDRNTYEWVIRNVCRHLVFHDVPSTNEGVVTMLNTLGIEH